MASSPPDARAGESPILVWLLLLPALVFAWPSPHPFAADFATTELSAAGVTALGTLPLLAWLAWKRPLPFRGALLVFVALLLPANFGSPTDALELDRATLTFLVGVLVATGAAALGEDGSARLLRGLAAVSILLIVPALFEAEGHGGVLGNSGELSGAALPGALGGMLLWAREASRWRWVGMVALGLLLLHALLAPVVATLVVLALVSAAGAALGRGLGPQARVKLASVLVTTAVGAGWLVFSEGDPEVVPRPGDTATAEAPAEATHFGGFAVRRLVWSASLDMALDHPFFGVGGGQFAARFPDYRDPRELELSNWQRRVEAGTEVEHPHNDWLLPWVEGGLVAGAAWSVFLGLVFLASLHALRGGATSRAAWAAGALGAVLGAALNAPLLYNPTASFTSFLFFGALLGPVARPRARGKLSGSLPRLLVLGLALLLVLYLPRAWGMARHGAALAKLAETTSATAQAEAIEEALEACPDSVTALSLRARWRHASANDLAGALEDWEDVLELRPARFEAWMQRGVLLARSGELAAARAAFDRALELDEGHPGLARNRARCFAESGLVDEALAEVERLAELGSYDELWLLDLATELVLRGFVPETLPLLERVDERFADLSGEAAWALDEEYRRNGQRKTADAFRTLAQLTWAHEQAEAGAWDDARRSLFQALRVMREYSPPAGPLRARVEHAALLWQAGEAARAREELAEDELARLNWAPLPVWAREALFAMGLGAD